jgi:transcriptional regulator with XRE-family HTH domain
MTKKMQVADNQSEKINIAGKIFAEIMQKYHINARNLALKLGVTPTQMSRYCNGATPRLSNSVIEKVLDNYPELSRVWLLTGEGAMLKGDGNTIGNGSNNKHSTVSVGLDGSRLLDQLDRKDEQIKNATEQVNRLLAIIERMQGA